MLLADHPEGRRFHRADRVLRGSDWVFANRGTKKRQPRKDERRAARIDRFAPDHDPMVDLDHTPLLDPDEVGAQRNLLDEGVE